MHSQTIPFEKMWLEVEDFKVWLLKIRLSPWVKWMQLTILVLSCEGYLKRLKKWEKLSFGNILTTKSEMVATLKSQRRVEYSLWMKRPNWTSSEKTSQQFSRRKIPCGLNELKSNGLNKMTLTWPSSIK